MYNDIRLMSFLYWVMSSLLSPVAESRKQPLHLQLETTTVVVGGFPKSATRGSSESTNLDKPQNHEMYALSEMFSYCMVCFKKA